MDYFIQLLITFVWEQIALPIQNICTNIGINMPTISLRIFSDAPIFELPLFELLFWFIFVFLFFYLIVLVVKVCIFPLKMLFAKGGRL